MKSKRHIVLYAIGAIVLLGVASVLLLTEKERLSYTTDLNPQGLATTTELIVTPPATQAPPEPVSAAQAFQFEIVTSELAQAKGLSGRDEIRSNYGMLFVFPKKDMHGFWMKDMLAPIDIIWITDNGTVLAVEEAVQPSSYPGIYRPPEPVRYVLETRAGEARRLGIVAGTKLNLPLPYGQTVSE